jgi:hypothetical protein
MKNKALWLQDVALIFQYVFRAKNMYMRCCQYSDIKVTVTNKHKSTERKYKLKNCICSLSYFLVHPVSGSLSANSSKSVFQLGQSSQEFSQKIRFFFCAMKCIWNGSFLNDCCAVSPAILFQAAGINSSSFEADGPLISPDGVSRTSSASKQALYSSL